MDLEGKLAEHERREFLLLSQISARDREVELYRHAHAARSTEQRSLMETLVDPVVNLEIRALRSRLAETEQKVENLQEELEASTFDPNTISGKKLIAKTRKLLDENADLGKRISEDHGLRARAELEAEKQRHQETREKLREAKEFSEILDEENEKLQAQIQELSKKLLEVRRERDAATSPPDAKRARHE